MIVPGAEFLINGDIPITLQNTDLINNGIFAGGVNTISLQEMLPHPSAVLVSIHKNSAGYLVQGNFTLKGITKLVEFSFSANPSRSGYVFSGGLFINRRAFGISGKSRK